MPPMPPAPPNPQFEGYIDIRPLEGGMFGVTRGVDYRNPYCTKVAYDAATRLPCKALATQQYHVTAAEMALFHGERS